MDKDVEQGNGQKLDKDIEQGMDKDWTRTEPGNGQGWNLEMDNKGRDEDMVWPLGRDVGEGWGDGERDREGGVLYSKRRRVRGERAKVCSSRSAFT